VHYVISDGEKVAIFVLVINFHILPSRSLSPEFSLKLGSFFVFIVIC